MSLIPFAKEHLRIHEALPFGVHDVSGRLLLASGAVIDTEERLAELSEGQLYADEQESLAWRRRLLAAVDSMVRKNARLKELAAAKPNGADERPGLLANSESVVEHWDRLALALDAGLRALGADARGDGLARVRDIARTVALLSQQRPNASLYYLIYAAGHSTERYSAHHGLLCAVVCHETAPRLGWSAAHIESLCLAALTMNVAMQRLQDQLAQQNGGVTPAVRAEIDAHATRGAALLAESGLEDALCIDIVRRHHEDGDPQRLLAQLEPAERLTRLLRRVDIFAAKLSRRGERQPMSPVQAARYACLGANNVPDEVGAALLKSVGLYPPGSFVELESGEIGIVVARGARSNLPMVATLLSAAGLLIDCAPRNTALPRHAVKGAVAVDRIHVQPPHARLTQLVR